ncbi:MAG TPA: CRISPR-associated helicase Cas3' [Candidatus Hydrogenedentes bacterium]|nr:CRISPR-associated helicase Cas3' [Candidatus Hydrogenedentota bacterium]
MLHSHSPNAQGQWRPLDAHLQNTAQDARTFGAAFNAGELAYCSGLWHDLGKLTPEFQAYLRDCAEGVPTPRRQRGGHSSTGAVWALEHGGDFLAFVLAGHHAGLRDSVDLWNYLQKSKNDPEIKETLGRAVELELADSPANDLRTLLPSWLSQGTKHERKRKTELFVRMLFSALVDADRLDAESHTNPDAAALRHTPVPSIPELLNAFIENQDELIRSAENTAINQARREMYETCLKQAGAAPGIFRLAMPTGAGKTRAAIGFALKHAASHGLRRVIVAVPYTTITDQTAAEYRKIFGPEAVLEHHSAVRHPEHDRSEEKVTQRELVAQNWDAPMIVTTTVQLFDSLFSNQPTKCRKLHNIAKSVIVLDEAQTLPLPLLEPILDVLQDLVDHYGVSVVLSTATQPALDESSRFLKGLRQVRDIIRQPRRYFDVLKRVRYEIPDQPWSWERVAAEMNQLEQCLTVVNTKKDAAALYKALGDPDALHLSTLMCPAHRQEVLAMIKEHTRSGNQAPCRVVSTQLVEAGVDIDFPAVFRALGPLDSIVQAAGRCNREGLLKRPGRVVVFQPADGGLPLGAYRSATAEAEKILAKPNLDLDAPELFREYFSSLYQAADVRGKRIQELREAFKFETLAKEFHIIDDTTESVFVNYKDSHELLEQARAKVRATGYFSKKDWQRLQPFMVNLYRNKLNGYRQQGLAEPCDDLGFDLWKGGYDDAIGLTAETLDPIDLIG